MYSITFVNTLSYLSLISIVLHPLLVAGDEHIGRYSKNFKFESRSESPLTSHAVKRSNVVTQTLTIANDIVNPDQFPKISTTVNGAYPGPLISANKGDSFKITVNNELSNPTLDLTTTVHYHGIFQQSNSWADGSAAVTQCPIIPGETFEYDFNAGGQTGTYWYHSHNGLQYCDGLRGPFVIYDPNDPLQWMYDVDDASTIISLADWYHVPAAEVPRPPDSNPITLINGLGRNPTNLTAPLSIINVQYGKRYRFRIISMSCEPVFLFSIDNHNLMVIEVDGVEIQPLQADSVMAYPGYRYSVILTANQPIGNYWVRALSNLGNGTFIGGQNSAILRYGNAPAIEPTTEYTTPVNTAQDTNMHPLVPVPVPGGPAPGNVDMSINLTFGFNEDIGLFTANGLPFTTPSIPVLLQILSGNANASELMPQGLVYPISYDSEKWPKSVEVTMSGLSTLGPHPMHLHGHNFAVVRSPGENSQYNFINPVIRDTVYPGATVNDSVVIRFNADNPGPWYLHCHVDFHLAKGYAVIIAEETSQIASTDRPSQSWYDLCTKYDNYMNSTNATQN